MRNITPTLLAAQQEAAGSPHVKVEALDRIAGVARLAFTRLHQSSTSDFYHAATCPGDGSLVRAVVIPGNGWLYTQRVEDPGPTSDFSSWTYIFSVSTGTSISLVSRGATVNLFYVNASRRNLFRLESTDYGATWSSPMHVVYPRLSGIAWLAAAYSDLGGLALFYASTNHDVYFTRRTGSRWSAPARWRHNVASITGMTCLYQNDWNLVLTGTERTTNDSKVWTCVYGDGGDQARSSWSPLREVATSRPSSLTTFHFPSMARPDVTRMTCVEKSTGVPSFERPIRSHSLAGASFSRNLWREPVPMDMNVGYGLAMAVAGSYLYLTTPSGVWRGSLVNETRDLTGDVMDMSLSEDAESGEAVVTLRNDDGRFGNVDGGSPPALRWGSELRISPGYLTAAGREVSEGPAYWIESFERRSTPGNSALVVRAYNAWRLLSKWTAGRQYAWGPGTTGASAILEFVLARAGLETDTSGASEYAATFAPAFTIHPGESGAAVVKRLLERLPDALVFRGHRGYLVHPQAEDAVDYSYGAGHAILRGRYASGARDYNRVQAFGDAHVGEAFAWDEVDYVSDRLLQVHDLNLDTHEKAQGRAEAALGKQRLASFGGEVVVPPNLGQELLDVIELTDVAAGLDAEKRRVLGIRLDYSRVPRPEYRQTLRLGGV